MTKGLRLLVMAIIAGGCSGDEPEDLSDSAVCAGAVEVFQRCLPSLQTQQVTNVQDACPAWLGQLADERTDAQGRPRAGLPALEERFRRSLKQGFGCYVEGASAEQMGFEEFKESYAQIAAILAAFQVVDGKYADPGQLKRSCLSREATPTSCESDFGKGAARTCGERVGVCSDEAEGFAVSDELCLFAPAFIGKAAWAAYEECVASPTCDGLATCLRAF